MTKTNLYKPSKSEGAPLARTSDAQAPALTTVPPSVGTQKDTSPFQASLNGAMSRVGCTCVDFALNRSCAHVWLANLIHLTVRRSVLRLHHRFSIDFEDGTRTSYQDSCGAFDGFDHVEAAGFER